MDAFQQMSSMDFDMKDILANTPVSNKAVQAHLSRSYVLLMVASAAAAAGSMIAIAVPSIMWMLSGTVGRLACMLGTMALMYAVHSSSGTSKVGWFVAFAATIGASLAPLINLAMDIDPTAVLNAVLLTVVVFGTFSFIAAVSSDRPMLWLGGTLISALNWMLLAGFVNMFLRSSWLFMSVEVYGGLILFCGFVVFDTQLLIARASAAVAAGAELGIDEAVNAALHLFMDAVNIFVRILIILLRNAQNNKKKERK